MRLDLDADDKIRELAQADAEKRMERLRRELQATRSLVPSWWVREAGHAAGGFAVAHVASHFGVPAAVSVGAVGVGAVVFERWLQSRLYPDLSKQHPRWKSIVDVAAWVTGAAGGVLAAGGF